MNKENKLSGEGMLFSLWNDQTFTQKGNTIDYMEIRKFSKIAQKILLLLETVGSMGYSKLYQYKICKNV